MSSPPPPNAPRQIVLTPSLGYSSSPGTDHPTSTALHITRPRKQDRRARKVTRSVFLCYVLGATGSGKTSLLRSFVNKGFSGGGAGDDSGVSAAAGLGGGSRGMVGYEPTTKVLSVVNSVEMEGVEKYLVVSIPSWSALAMGTGVIVAHVSCKSLDPNTRARRCAIAKSWTWRT